MAKLSTGSNQSNNSNSNTTKTGTSQTPKATITGNSSRGSFQATVSTSLIKEGNSSGVGLSPKQLFELVSKNYETWLQAMTKQFENDVDESNYSPFPNEDDKGDTNVINEKSNPIFNYSLLEALDAASNDMNEQLSATTNSSSSSVKPKDGKRRILDPSTHTLLNEREIDFLRHKITQIIQHNNETTEGFNLYDTKDEEGLHEGNCGCCDEYDQDDYDLEEINGDENYAYDIPPTHHIEVELNTSSDCPIHGSEGCDCPIFSHHIRSGMGGDNDDDDDDDYDDDDDRYAPSCEFMFEYDLSGKLIPTYNNVAEKLREMEANGGRFPFKNHRLKLPSIEELHARDENLKKQNKKKKKKKVKTTKSDSNPPITRTEDLVNISQIKVPQNSYKNDSSTIPKDFIGFIPSNECCLLCEYEAVFGSKPKQMIKWYEQRINAEEKRRAEFKRKLQNAKLKALRKQKDMRQKSIQQQQQQQQQQKHSNPKPLGPSNPESLQSKIDEVD